jgi:hypothetical protein
VPKNGGDPMSEKSTADAYPDGVTPLEEPQPCAMEQQILDFLYGKNDGAAVLDALYGDTLDELLPPRLADLVKSWRVV